MCLQGDHAETAALLSTQRKLPQARLEDYALEAFSPAEAIAISTLARCPRPSFERACEEEGFWYSLLMKLPCRQAAV